MWASVLAEEAVAAEARDLATPRQLGSQPNLDNLLRAREPPVETRPIHPLVASR